MKSFNLLAPTIKQFFPKFLCIFCTVELLNLFDDSITSYITLWLFLDCLIKWFFIVNRRFQFPASMLVLFQIFSIYSVTKIQAKLAGSWDSWILKIKSYYSESSVIIMSSDLMYFVSRHFWDSSFTNSSQCAIKLRTFISNFADIFLNY